MNPSKPLPACPFKTFLLFPTTFFLIGIFSSTLAQQTYLPFKETTSPDGRYCIAWGIEGEQIDAANSEELLANLDSETVENYLFDIDAKAAIATLGSSNFETEEIHKNRGAITVIWREDSGAFILEESARFGSSLIVFVEIFEASDWYEAASDVIPLTKAMIRAVIGKAAEEIPDKAEILNDLTISISPIEWIGQNKIRAKVIGEVPKDPEGFIYENIMTFTLPLIEVKAE